MTNGQLLSIVLAAKHSYEYFTTGKDAVTNADLQTPGGRSQLEQVALDYLREQHAVWENNTVEHVDAVLDKAIDLILEARSK